MNILAYLCCATMVYIHGAELWDRQHGILSFLSVKSDLDSFRAIVYSYAWATMFAVLTVLLAFFNIRKNVKTSVIITVIVMVLFAISFYMDARFYYKL